MIERRMDCRRMCIIVRSRRHMAGGGWAWSVRGFMVYESIQCSSVVNVIVYAVLVVLEDFVQSTLAGLRCTGQPIGHDGELRETITWPRTKGCLLDEFLTHGKLPVSTQEILCASFCWGPSALGTG